ncbi:MAG: hypothetical protein ACTS8Y_01015, partial [Arsenophonus sp. ER-EMS1-MAG3]
GIGKIFHEKPQVLHYDADDGGIILKKGMTFTIWYNEQYCMSIFSQKSVSRIFMKLTSLSCTVHLIITVHLILLSLM